MAFSSSPILLALKNRLRVTYVSDAAFTDDDVLSMLNDAYLDVCQSTQILKTLTTITPVVDTQEYALPADFDEAIYVVTAGRQLQPMPIDTALQDFVPDGFVDGYYLYGSLFGLVPVPTTVSSVVYLLYSATPTPLTDYGQALDPRFPPEFSDVLLHWVRWRAQIMVGGAERIPTAQLDRQIYDARIKELRRVADSIPHQSALVLNHVQRRERKLVI